MVTFRMFCSCAPQASFHESFPNLNNIYLKLCQGESKAMLLYKEITQKILNVVAVVIVWSQNDYKR